MDSKQPPFRGDSRRPALGLWETLVFYGTLCDEGDFVQSSDLVSEKVSLVWRL